MLGLRFARLQSVLGSLFSAAYSVHPTSKYVFML